MTPKDVGDSINQNNTKETLPTKETTNTNETPEKEAVVVVFSDEQLKGLPITSAEAE